MIRDAVLSLAAAGLLALPGGCGGNDSSAAPSEEKNDDRAAVLECLRGEGVDAHVVGENRLQVGDPKTGPRIQFFLTAGEAEAKQFEGRAEGSEQIGSTLLFVRRGSDGVLEQVEACLDQL